MDNASSHILTFSDEVDMQGLTLLFLPANTTCWVQPMDAGIIASFETHYRSKLLAWMIQEMDCELEKMEERRDFGKIKPTIKQACVCHYVQLLTAFSTPRVCLLSGTHVQRAVAVPT